ncbi:MAG TPA: 2-hydroxymuconate tautomerase [Chloroflexia bacterium]|nr:2-hydroxymuconate tautomerase [Chloroflexia bacterium]
MPIIRAEILEGRTPEMKERFIEALTAAAVEALGVRAEQVRVIINEMPKTNYGIAGKSVARRDREAAEQK